MKSFSYSYLNVMPYYFATQVYNQCTLYLQEPAIVRVFIFLLLQLICAQWCCHKSLDMLYCFAFRHKPYCCLCYGPHFIFIQLFIQFSISYSDSQLNVFHVSFEFIQFEVRDDEEQKVKLTQTIELLLAAGYFRARIKGLSPFDRVIFL